MQTMTMIHPFAGGPRTGALRVAGVALAVSAVLLGGCGDKKDRASQTAAKVDKHEITVQQVNFILQQQRGLRPEQVDAAGRQILERLIDQQLAVDEAENLRLDRDPRVVLQLEAARREVMARVYAEHVGEQVPKPAAEEIRKYYDDNPALFSQRRIYTLQELAIEAAPEQVATLRDTLAANKTINEFVDYLKAHNFRFAVNQVVRAAEQLPLQRLPAFAQLKDGQAVLTQVPNGLQILVLAGSTMQSVSEEQARPAIEAFLLNERKRKALEDDIKKMRSSSRIEYVGKFAEGAPPAASAADTGLGTSSGDAASPVLAPAAGGGLADTGIGKGMESKE